MNENATIAPPVVDEEWAGGGMTVRILGVWDDGYSVLRLTGQGRRLKRPTERGFIPARNFTDGRMVRVLAAPVSSGDA